VVGATHFAATRVSRESSSYSIFSYQHIIHGYYTFHLHRYGYKTFDDEALQRSLFSRRARALFYFPHARHLRNKSPGCLRLAGDDDVVFVLQLHLALALAYVLGMYLFVG
jgi:hypothetical protein